MRTDHQYLQQLFLNNVLKVDLLLAQVYSMRNCVAVLQFLSQYLSGRDNVVPDGTLNFHMK